MDCDTEMASLRVEPRRDRVSSSFFPPWLSYEIHKRVVETQRPASVELFFYH